MRDSASSYDDADSYYKISAVLKCLNKLAESPVFDDLIFISMSEKNWKEFEKELKMTVDKFLMEKDLN